jgi:hypothetical protein
MNLTLAVPGALGSVYGLETLRVPNANRCESLISTPLHGDAPEAQRWLAPRFSVGWELQL